MNRKLDRKRAGYDHFWSCWWLFGNLEKSPQKRRNCLCARTKENQNISDQLGPLPVKPYHLHQISQKLTWVSSLQLGTAKLFAYAELIKSEFNKISGIFNFGKLINFTSFSRFADMIKKIIRNSRSKMLIAIWIRISNSKVIFRNRLIDEFHLTI